MAINKRKVLQSAQKNLQKGALDKALKDYQTLLKADPKDSNVRLKIGDIHLKQGNTEEAVGAYLKVADRFMTDGFDAKAVALYKQIVRIDDKRLDVYTPLAELYQRLGLSSDAMAALQTAADAHYRDGNRNEALDLLRRMAALDPTNTANRMKVADLLRQEERNEEAITEFEAVAEELERQNDREGRVKALERIVELDPARTGSLVQLARAQLAADRAAVAEKTARALVKHDGDEPVHHELLAEALEKTGKAEEARAAWQRVAALCRERGDDDRARDLTQRYGDADEFAGGDTDVPVLEQTDELAFGEPGAAEDLALPSNEYTDPGFVAQDGLELGSPLDGATATHAAGSDAAAGRTPTPEAADAGETISLSSDAERLVDASPSPVEPDAGADPEQLVAEASVLLRYGKHARAVETLRGVLQMAPDHVQALEKLAEACEASGDPTGASEARERLERLATGAAPASAVPEPSDDVAATDVAADELFDDIDIDVDAGLAEDVAGAPGDTPAAVDLELEEPDSGVDLDLENELDEVAPEAAQASSAAEAAAPSAPIEPVADASDGIDFDLDLDLDDPAEPAAADAGDEAGAEASDLLDDTGPSAELDEIDLDIVADDPAAQEASTREGIDLDAAEIPDLDEALAAEVSPEGVGAEAGEATPSSSSTTPQQMVEDLEEADFYFQQGLFAEARAVYERILAVAPSHPQAMLRLGEIDAADADDGPDASDLAMGPEADEAPARADRAGMPADATLDLVDTTGEAGVGLDLGDGFGLDMDDDALDATGEGDALDDEADEDALDVAEDVALEDAAGDDGPQPIADASAAAPETASEPQADLEPPETAEDSLAPEPEAGEVQATATQGPPEAELDEPHDALTEEGLAADPNEDSGSFDLAAELADILGSDDDTASGSAGATEEEGFEQVFAAFKEGVQNELGEGDHEAHYDLGIAYKEMGLLDDAIQEFGRAMEAPDRALPCLHMMGLCALDLGRVGDAVAHFEQALALPEIPAEHQVGLRFDLGRGYAEQGDLDRARVCFEAVIEAEPGFGDAAERLAALDTADVGPPGADIEEPAEAFESFDDLIGEADVTEARPEEPEYESFDGLTGDHDDDDDDDEALGEPTIAAEAPDELAIAAEAPDELAIAAEAPDELAIAAEADDEAVSPEDGLEAMAEVTAEPIEAEPLPDDAPEAEGAATDADDAEPSEAPPEPAPKGRRKKISFF